MKFEKAIVQLDERFKGALDVPYKKQHEIFYEAYQFEEPDDLLAGMSLVLDFLSDWGIGEIVNVEVDFENCLIRIS